MESAVESVSESIEAEKRALGVELIKNSSEDMYEEHAYESCMINTTSRREAERREK